MTSFYQKNNGIWKKKQIGTELVLKSFGIFKTFTFSFSCQKSRN